MNCSQYVGRVGALAAALGIGTALMAWPTVAVAGPEEGADQQPVSVDSDSEGGGTGAGVAPTAPDSNDNGPAGLGIFRHNPLRKIFTGLTGIANDIGRGVVADGADSPFVPRKSRQPKPADDTDAVTVKSDDVPSVQAKASFDPPKLRSGFQASRISNKAEALAPRGDAPAAVAETSRTLLSPSISSGSIAQLRPTVPDVVAAPARLGLNIITGVLNAALSPFAGQLPGGVPPSPTLFAVLAWVRREIQHTFLNQRPTLVAVPGTTQLVGDVVGGRVTGTDADGDDLTYTASGGAEGSLVTVDDEGNWTYTAPAGAVGTTPYTDTFTITASDGTGHLHGLSGLFRPDGGHTRSVDVAVSVNPESTITPPPGDPDPVTGKVEGSLGVSGTATSPLTITVVDPPKYGTLALDPVTGNYVYTPNQAGRLKAAIAAASGQTFTDSFTVNVTQGAAAPQTFARTAAFSTLAAAANDGNDITVEGIKIPGSTITAGPTIPVGDGPAGIVMTDKYAYVINTDLNSPNSTVSVIDLEDGTVVGDPIPVGRQSFLGAVKDDKVYVTNFNGTISVLRTDPDTDITTVVDVDGVPANGVTPIEVGGFLVQAVADPDPTVHRLYVVSAANGVYVIDTEHDTIVDTDLSTPGVVDTITVPPEIGTIGALSFSSDGKRLYGSAARIVGVTQPTDEEPGGYQIEGQVVVIDTDPASPTYNQVIDTGLAADVFPAVSATSGDKLFVLDSPLAGVVLTKNPDGSTTATYPPGVVRVVDLAEGSPTYGEVLYDVPVSSQAVYLTTTPDKSLVYVVSISDGTIAVIDTAEDDPSKAVLQTFTYNSNQPGGAYNLIAVSNDGKQLYVSNLAQDSVSTYTLT